MFDFLLNFQSNLLTTPHRPETFFMLLLVALVLGSLIGMERQIHNRNAGIRTNALVCVGTTIFVSMAYYLPMPWEPARIVAQVVSGIGFLGAGLIYRNGSVVEGLDTAATVWCTAAVGTFVGTGRIIEALLGACVILVLNIILRKFTKRFFSLSKQSVAQQARFDIWLDAGGDEKKREACEAIADALSASKKFSWVASNIDWDNQKNRTPLHSTFACLKKVDSVNEWLVQFSNVAKIDKWTWSDEPDTH